MLKRIIQGIGLFQIGYAGVQGYDYLKRYGWHANCELKSEYPSEYALVTGASQGLGHGYAEELAKRGYNVILVSRASDKLTKAAEELQGKYSNVKILAKPLDLEKVTVESLQQWFKELNSQFGNEIGIFVNAAAALESQPFQALKLSTIQSVLQTNILGSTLLIHNQLKYAQTHPEKKTLLVNVGSQKAERGSPEQQGSVYYATKQYMNSLTANLAKQYTENNNNNIQIVNVAPGYIDSPMLHQFYPNFKDSLAGKFVEQPSKIAKQTFDQIDLSPSVINGTDKHALGNVLLKLEELIKQPIVKF